MKVQCYQIKPAYMRLAETYNTAMQSINKHAPWHAPFCYAVTNSHFVPFSYHQMLENKVKPLQTKLQSMKQLHADLKQKLLALTDKIHVSLAL